MSPKKKRRGKEPKAIVWNKKTWHPSVKYEQADGYSKSLGITHGKTTFKKKNQRLRKNPNAKDEGTSFVVRRIQKQPDKTYGTVFDEWKLSKKDATKVKHLIKKLERREMRKKMKSKKKSD
jgi:hypothetical protein